MPIVQFIAIAAAIMVPFCVVFIYFLLRGAGWLAIQKAYPDCDENPDVRLTSQSAWMGKFIGMPSVFFNGSLTLDACPSGLRMSLWRLLGPLKQSFLVPWDEIAADGTELNFPGKAALQFARLRFARLPERDVRMFRFRWNQLVEQAGRDQLAVR